MSTSRREAIMVAVLGKLNTLVAIPPTSVFRSRETAITRGDAPAIVLRKDIDPFPDNRNVDERRFSFVVEVYTRGENAEADADPIECEVHSALMAERTLGGACNLLIADDTIFVSADADQPAHRTEMHFIAVYRVPSDDLTTAA